MLDTSRNMLTEAKKKFMGKCSPYASFIVGLNKLSCTEKHPQYKSAFFLVHDASEPIPSPSGKPFDVAVQTMGLCSQDDPVKVLQNVGKCVKDDGKIIILEHGRSHYQWLNQILDAYAPEHWSTWGCWW